MQQVCRISQFFPHSIGNKDFLECYLLKETVKSRRMQKAFGYHPKVNDFSMILLITISWVYPTDGYAIMNASLHSVSKYIQEAMRLHCYSNVPLLSGAFVWYNTTITVYSFPPYTQSIFKKQSELSSNIFRLFLFRTPHRLKMIEQLKFSLKKNRKGFWIQVYFITKREWSF